MFFDCFTFVAFLSSQRHFVYTISNFFLKDEVEVHQIDSFDMKRKKTGKVQFRPG